jgi:hypothetical protein
MGDASWLATALLQAIIAGTAGLTPVVADRPASGWRKPAGFPHAGTLARGGGRITFGENSLRKVKGPQRTYTGGLTPHRSPDSLQRLGYSSLPEPHMADITSTKLLWAKGVLFVLIGAISSVLLLWESPSLKVALLLALAVWAFCRAYYFAFYVIERYADPSYRFSGLMSFLRYACRRRTHD